MSIGRYEHASLNPSLQNRIRSLMVWSCGNYCAFVCILGSRNTPSEHFNFTQSCIPEKKWLASWEVVISWVVSPFRVTRSQGEANELIFSSPPRLSQQEVCITSSHKNSFCIPLYLTSSQCRVKCVERGCQHRTHQQEWLIKKINRITLQWMHITLGRHAESF